MMQLFRTVFFIAAAVLGFVGWRSDLRWMIVAVLALALLALAAWFAIDWRRGFSPAERPAREPGDTSV